MKEIIINELMHLIGVAVAVVLGFAIGFERKLRYKEAGIRTHAIVCVGAALIMVVSKYAFAGMDADASRVAAQIVSGVGFLGAGIIMLRGQKMHGLTTAAGIWATAGVGRGLVRRRCRRDNTYNRRAVHLPYQLQTVQHQKILSRAHSV